MDINDLTIVQAKELAAMFGVKENTQPSHPYEIGRNYNVLKEILSLLGVSLAFVIGSGVIGSLLIPLFVFIYVNWMKFLGLN